jgi:uncharacterized coiled-coil DUF342 family protein
VSELETARAQMEEKVKKKRELIKQLRDMAQEISKMQEELKEALPKDRDVRKKSPDRIKEEIEKLEFQIATSAYTPVQEKNMIRRMKTLKAEYKNAIQNNSEWKEVYAIKDKIRTKRKDRKKIKKELDSLSKELDELYKQIIAESAKNAKDRKARFERREDSTQRLKRREDYKKKKAAEKKEMEPYMKEIDSFVSLEDIAEIKKKQKEEHAK